MCFTKLILQKVKNYQLEEKLSAKEVERLVAELTEIHYKEAKQSQFRVGHLNIINQARAAKESGAKVIVFAPTLALAKKQFRSGADALVIEGMGCGPSDRRLST